MGKFQMRYVIDILIEIVEMNQQQFVVDGAWRFEWIRVAQFKV